LAGRSAPPRVAEDRSFSYSPAKLRFQSPRRLRRCRQDLDFVAADGKPIVLIFVHDVNRQSIGMTRILSQYTVSRAKDGLHTGVVWLHDDATEAENTLKRVRHALAAKAPIGVSPDGREGPGSYGLNRNVMLTILVGKEGKVTGNFALVQPSLQADLPKILKSVAAVAGANAALEELAGMANDAQSARRTRPQPPPLLAPLIRLASRMSTRPRRPSKNMAEDAARKEVGRNANTIIDSGKLGNYGTAKQEYLRKCAKEYGKERRRADGSPDAATESVMINALLCWCAAAQPARAFRHRDHPRVDEGWLQCRRLPRRGGGSRRFSPVAARRRCCGRP
jgi:hypothetical protein